MEPGFDPGSLAYVGSNPTPSAKAFGRDRIIDTCEAYDLTSVAEQVDALSREHWTGERPVYLAGETTRPGRTSM